MDARNLHPWCKHEVVEVTKNKVIIMNPKGKGRLMLDRPSLVSEPGFLYRKNDAFGRSYTVYCTQKGRARWIKLGERPRQERDIIDRLQGRTVGPIDIFPTLGLYGSFTEEELRRAYRNGVKAHHPDTGGNAETFRKLVDEYEQALIYARHDNA